MDLDALQLSVSRHLDAVTELRRDLHRHPERSHEERRTASVVADALRKAGIAVQTGVGGHGVVAVLGDGEPCILLRADMDALPLEEQTGLPWASETPGVMHACGHDFHTAWLAGTALVLQDLGVPRGSVKIVFQPAEEGLGGATAMIADGVLDAPAVSAVCAGHVWPDLATGSIALRPGPNLAAADRFSITVTGAGTHGANPHKGHDPVPVAAEIILALQTLVSRRLDPLSSAVVSVCHIAAGSAFNIIPTEAVIEGTVRTLRPDEQDLIQSALTDMAVHIAAAHECAATVDYLRGVPQTIADADMTDLARRAMSGVLGAENVVPQDQLSMGAEDFSYFLQRAPGTLLWVGCTAPGTTDVKPLHHPGFIGDEGCLGVTMKALAAIALEYLARV